MDYASTQSSERERAAELAERDVKDYYKAVYMADKVGEEFDGVVSSVTSFGMFIELPNKIEGLVRIDDLTDDYYRYDESLFALVGLVGCGGATTTTKTNKPAIIFFHISYLHLYYIAYLYLCFYLPKNDESIKYFFMGILNNEV